MKTETFQMLNLGKANSYGLKFVCVQVRTLRRNRRKKVTEIYLWSAR